MVRYNRANDRLNRELNAKTWHFAKRVVKTLRNKELSGIERLQLIQLDILENKGLAVTLAINIVLGSMFLFLVLPEVVRQILG